ncbi:MAG: sigma-54 dependent transcriptional regulator [Planctomycetota bacterium]
MAQILLLDDEQPLLQSLSLELGRAGHECLVAESGREAFRLLEKSSPDLAILDVQLPDISGLEVLRRLRADLPEVPVLIITAYASVDSAVEAMKEGASDYLEKPLDLEELQLVVNRELKNARLRSEVEAYRRERSRKAEEIQIIGTSPALGRVREVVERLSSLPLENAAELPTVLIEGETGTGKDLLARFIHSQGPLAQHPFVQVNCSSLPRELVESELFGYEKGAFTGANLRKQGLFEVAQGGTIFLDEIGDMDLGIQAKLLSVIEGKRVRRVGGTREHPVEVRIIAATNRKLQEAREAGQFRSDLYFRLKVVHIHLPPLRERREDIPALASHFFDKFKRKYRKDEVVLDQKTMEKLRQLPWPGNIRELAHTLEHMVLTSAGNTLDSTPGLPGGLPGDSQNSGGQAAPASGFDFNSGECTLEAVERNLILEALRHTGGNISEVARLLGLTRGALRHRMDKWEIRA